MKSLNESLHISNRDIFGRGVTITEKFVFDEYYVLLYFFPFVQTNLPVFLPWTLSSGELEINFQILLGTTYKEELSRLSEVVNVEFDEDTPLIVLSTDHLFIPKTYSWQIKYIIFKLASHTSLVKLPMKK